MEALLVVVVLGLAGIAVAVATRGERRAAVVLAVVLVLGSSVSAAVLRRTERRSAARAPGLPRSDDSSMYVSSSACRACHPGEHASFTRTFHRTMTREATPETVLAPFERRGGEVFYEGRRVVMTTGSHREQAYWERGTRRGELVPLPVVWMIREGRLLARRDAFLNPPDASLAETTWASNCIACHAVAGQPRRDREHDAWDTRVAELGIACEACHGPGAAHVSRHRDPIERYRQHASGRADPTIVQPARLTPARSAAVCGQCHAYAYPRDEAEWWAHGYAEAFRAGDPLEPSRIVLGPETFGRPGAPRIDADVSSLFWSDGAIRVGGREYNGLVASACFRRGDAARKVTCLSCHSMHQGDPSGQIAPDRAGDLACEGCHEVAAEHTHHREGSAGSSCLGCHMPKTSYALLSAVRSHRIDAPDAWSTLATGRPNACNLCHLDRSLAWTAERLSAWYGIEAPPPDRLDGRVSVPEGVFGALAGDAAVRVLVADALGSADAIAATGPAFAAPILDVVARDPYAAVRFVAERSRRAASAPGAPLDPALLRSLLAARDPRAITIAE